MRQPLEQVVPVCSAAQTEPDRLLRLTFWLFLSVSVGLCEIPEPSQELVDKYNGLKAVFYRRLLNAYNRFQNNAAPLLERLSQSDQAQAATAFTGNSEVQRGYKAAAKIAA